MITQELQFKLRNSGYTSGFELSELIEACGNDFISLHQKLFVEKEHSWYAVGARKDESTFTCFGLIPEEAVANLWLKLNPPQKNN